MHIVFLHAPERCEPCRDMGERLTRVAGKHPKLSEHLRTIHVDKDPRASDYSFKVIPTILVIDGEEEIFRAEGRISEVLAERVVADVIKGTWNPEEFRDTAPSGNVVFYRTYARRTESEQRETYAEAIHRVVEDIARVGKFDDKEKALVLRQALQQHALPSGRWMWTGGTKWIREQRNFSGAYNCTNTTVNDLSAFGLMMELAMMGSGTGAILEDHIVKKLPKVHNAIKITKVTDLGEKGGSTADSMKARCGSSSATPARAGSTPIRP